MMAGMLRTSALASLIAACLSTQAACKDNQPTPVARDEQVATGAQVGQIARPTVELTNPGAEPRRQLRYRLVEGAEDVMNMQIDLAIETTADGVPLPVPETPPVVMQMRLAITELKGPKEARYRFALESVEVEDDPASTPGAGAHMRQALAGAAGMSGHAMVDDRGFNWDAQINPPEQLTPEIQHMMESASRGMDQVSAPLPEQPVGVGATWSLTQDIEQGGVKLTQVTHFELIELDDDTGTLRTRTTQEAPSQALALAGMPPGSAELAGFKSTGSGRIHFDLNRLVPRSTLAMRSEYEVRMQAEGEPSSVSTVIEMRIEVAPH